MLSTELSDWTVRPWGRMVRGPVGPRLCWMVHACLEQIRVPSFVLRLLAKFAELAREISL
jgi:hypothetical protein